MQIVAFDSMETMVEDIMLAKRKENYVHWAIEGEGGLLKISSILFSRSIWREREQPSISQSHGLQDERHPPLLT